MTSSTTIDPLLAELLDRYDLDRDSADELLRTTRAQVEAEVAEVVAARDAGASPVPEIDRCDLDPGDEEFRALVRRRGCVLVRSTFDPDEVAEWDAEIGDYLERNRFLDLLAARDPEYAASGSGIWGIYWSKPQVAARQHPRMVEVRTYLNTIWNHGDGRQWFDPVEDIGYADRIRRRRPGAVARGLAPHCDSPASSGWHARENHDVFREVLSGHPERHDPWDAAHRTGVVDTATAGVAAPADSFRTFQGWTALTEQHPSDGGLVVAPTPSALAYLLVKGIAGELGAFGDPVPTPRRVRCDDVLAPAVTPIPVIRPGDTIWWHGDLIHGVGDAANDTRWSNVMYVPSSPRCPRNDAYAAPMRAWFEAGESPIDFPAEHFETGFTGRATVADLNAIGRRQLGLDPLPGGR